MTKAWLLYLAAATGCQLVFALLYRLVLASLSTFGWNRAYLLSALVLSTLLPLLAPPAAWLPWLGAPAGASLVALPGSWSLAAHSATANLAGATAPPLALPWLPLVLAGYWLGVAWQVARTGRSLMALYHLGRQYPRTRLGRSWLVQLPTPGQPAFSFGNCVFLSPQHAQLSSVEYAQLLQHEQAHGAQHHSLDLLLAEGLGWFFWFNGLVAYLGQQLRTVHEYLADAAAAPPTGSRAAYGHLLLKLAAAPPPGALVHSFATRQVAQRLLMLTSPTSSPIKKLRFLLALPVATAAWLGAAALGPRPALAAQPLVAASATAGRIGTIAWQGNIFLTAVQLNEALGLAPGDPYSKETVDARLNYRLDGRDVTSRYLDHGYLFFSVDPVATPQPAGTTNLLFKITEGTTARLNTITVKGNRTVPTAAIVQLTRLHSGELFSRAKLIAAQRSLAASGLFVPTEININPQPIPDKGLVNMEFIVTEK
ncbi:MAG: POTRA domain-containing protein [Janthinobacterium lividum]